MLTFRRTNYLLFAGLLILNLSHFFTQVSGWWYLGWGLFYLTLVSIGSVRVCSNFHFRVLCKARPGSQGVVLSYDDGPDPEKTPALLKVLKQHEARAIFFLIGHKAQSHPELVRQIIIEGHIIGNHTFGHSNWFDMFAPWVMAREMKRTSELVRSITGLEMNWFRPPFGVTNPMMTRAMKLTGLKAIGWSIRSFDTVIRDRQRVLDRILKATHGDIILMHDDRPGVEALTEEVIIALKKRGIGVADPLAVIEEKPYKSIEHEKENLS
jgi:peptidoglycan/xylan/chitin deacetylase (PgdA/CDA1 family)